MDECSGLDMTSAFCPIFLFQHYVYLHVYTTFLFSRFHEMYKISGIYSVNGSQESREIWNISRARDKFSEWLKEFA